MRPQRCPRCGSSSDLRHVMALETMQYWRCHFCAHFWPIASSEGDAMPEGEVHTSRFRHGDHICAIYDTPEEQRRVAVEFVADGLRVNERCLYAAASCDALTRFCDDLRAMNVDPLREVARGALVLLTKEQAHLVDGRFDSERMLKMLNDGLEAALDAGYTGFRTCGDMSWLLDEAPGSTQVVEYEAFVTQFFKTARGLGMCQYDRTRLAAPLLTQALATHLSVVIDGRYTVNPFHTSGPVSPTDFDADIDSKLAELRRQAH